jgi:translation initiation factor 3 subunit I
MLTTIYACEWMAFSSLQASSFMTEASKRRDGGFEARIFNAVSQKEITRVKGHFGPINSLAVHPASTQFASGSEDGLIRVQNFDQSYFEYKREK